MKNLILILILGLTMMGCSSKTAVQEGTEISEQPDWVQAMGSYDKGQGAIGSSPKSSLGSQVQREDALLAEEMSWQKILNQKSKVQLA